MEMTDKEIENLLVNVKRIASRILRPFALALLAFVLCKTQAHFNYPNTIVAGGVFVLAASSSGLRSAFAVILFLMALVLLPPEAFVAIGKLADAFAIRAS